MKKRFSKILTSIVLIILVAIPGFASADTATASSGEVKTSFSEKFESNYLFKGLAARNIDSQKIADFLGYLDKHGYFKWAKSGKIAYLNRIKNNHRLYFWKIIPAAISIENANNWNTSNAKNIDWFQDKCFAGQVKNDIAAASKFFVGNWCKTNIGHASKNITFSDFYDKNKWSEADLETLYTRYWPDKQNFRYRPYFTDQEMNNLKAMVSVIFHGQNTSSQIGAYCDNQSDQGLQDITFDTILMAASLPSLLKSIAGELAGITTLTTDQIGTLGGYTIAERAKILESTLEIAPDVVGTQAKTLVRYWETNGGSDLFFRAKSDPFFTNRFFQSGIPEEEWVKYDAEQFLIFSKAMKGRIINLSNTEIEQYYKWHVKFDSSARFDQSDTLMMAPRQLPDGSFGFLRVNSAHLKNISTLDIRNAYAHEYFHYLRTLASPRLATGISSEAKEALTLQGYSEYANPFEEGTVEFFAHVQFGELWALSYNQVPYDAFVRNNMKYLIPRIMKVKHCSYSNALDIWYDAFFNPGSANDMKLFYDLYRHAYNPKLGFSGYDYFQAYNNALATNNTSVLDYLLNSPIQ